MFHGAYNLQNCHKADKLNKIYVFIRSAEGLKEILTPYLRANSDEMVVSWCMHS